MIIVEHIAGREVQRGDGKSNHLKCSRNHPWSPWQGVVCVGVAYRFIIFFSSR